MHPVPPSLAEALAHIATHRAGHAWSVLVGIATAPVLALACRLTGDSDLADDVLQETLLAVLEQAPRFQPRDDPDRDALRWILALAAHRALRLRRDRMRSRRRDDRACNQHQAPPQPSADEALSVSERHQRLHAALSALDEPWRTALTLRYLTDLGYDDIASSMRVPVGTAKTHVHRGLERLRRCLPGGLETWSGVALAERPQLTGPAQPSGLAATLRAWVRTSCRPGALLAVSASTVLSLGVATLLCVAAQAGDAPAPAPGAAVAEPPAAAPPPLLRLVPQRVEARWTLSPDLHTGQPGPLISTQSYLAVTCSLQGSPTSAVAGFRLDHLEARTDGGMLLPGADVVEGRLDDHEVTLQFAAPPLGSQRLSLQGTLTVDIDDAPPQMLDIAPVAAADRRWLSCAGHPNWLFQFTRSNRGCDLLMTPSMLRALGKPVLGDVSGHELPTVGWNFWNAPRYGQIMDFRGFYPDRSSDTMRVSLPLHDCVHEIVLPFLIDGVALSGASLGLGHYGHAPIRKVAQVPSAGLLPCMAVPGTAADDAPRPLLHPRYAGYNASLSLDFAQPRAPAPPGKPLAGAAEMDLRHAPRHPQFGSYELHFIVSGGGPRRILALDEALVTAATTDAGEELVGNPRGAHSHFAIYGRFTPMDNCLNHTDDLSFSAWTQLPRRATASIRSLQGLLLVEAATAAPIHLRMASLQDYLGRWLSAPGHPACALRATLQAGEQFGSPIQRLHLERTAEMALVMRNLTVRTASGDAIATNGDGSGGGVDGSDYVDLTFPPLPADTVLEADLFLIHAPIEAPFVADDLTIAVPAAPAQSLSTERLPDAALHPIILSLRPQSALPGPLLQAEEAASPPPAAQPPAPSPGF